MAEKEIVETSEAEIAVHWGEEELISSKHRVYCPGEYDRCRYL